MRVSVADPALARGGASTGRAAYTTQSIGVVEGEPAPAFVDGVQPHQPGQLLYGDPVTPLLRDEGPGPPTQSRC